jgi:hypothetical protein
LVARNSVINLAGRRFDTLDLTGSTINLQTTGASNFSSALFFEGNVKDAARAAQSSGRWQTSGRRRRGTRSTSTSTGHLSSGQQERRDRRRDDLPRQPVAHPARDRQEVASTY